MVSRRVAHGDFHPGGDPRFDVRGLRRLGDECGHDDRANGFHDGDDLGIARQGRGAINAGNGIFSAAFAVALSSMRLTPMVVALIPEMRTPRTSKWMLYLVSHFVAVTAWVLALEQMHRVPPERRTVWFLGLGSTLILINMIVVAVIYTLAADLPDALSAALLLLTPLYFVTSLWGSARERAGHVAMISGLLLWPLIHLVLPDFSLLATGVIGGAIAFGYHRHARGKRKRAAT
jgi:predicted branched-subunit amino acid permease